MVARANCRNTFVTLSTKNGFFFFVARIPRSIFKKHVDISQPFFFQLFLKIEIIGDRINHNSGYVLETPVCYKF